MFEHKFLLQQVTFSLWPKQKLAVAFLVEFING